ncbi:glycosyltransferase [Sediminibacter sp. Hel_I_10]|uniref:glycosyltransferase n=1 Tax=Sediminibacter sp. Hel_I_10 TaxID=1392490 RepID=UPI00047B7A09|nr:glycosyltransferase [Sediminibacter sp. Hel_I_10]
MKILIVNTFDTGGAANACLRLHEGLLEQNVNVSLLLKHRIKSLPSTYSFKPISKSKNKWQIISSKFISALRLLGIFEKKAVIEQHTFRKTRNQGLEFFSFPNSSFDITQSEFYQEADIINLHWVANFLDYKSFFEKNTKPVVWTLHDMNPFTGGEHYNETILGMKDDGFPITRKLTTSERNVFQKNLDIKEKALAMVSNLTIVTPSRWLAKEARKSALFKNRPIHCIPYGINPDIFQPRDSVFSRLMFQIPSDKKVILFVADSISNHRKGYVFLKRAFNMLNRSDVVLCAIGSKKNDLETTSNVIELGAIVDERLMSLAFSAADVFVIPSLMDNLPNTVLESLMCGTPVIGFPIGGMPDMIEHGVNGLLTKTVDAPSLSETLNEFLESIEAFDKTDIRSRALLKYSLNIQATNYMNLFHDIINN